VPNSDSVKNMTDAAGAFLDGLAADAADLARVRFDDATARRDWHYIPRERAGLAFTAMDATQQKRAYQLVATGLSLPAFAAVTTIIGLEDVLSEIEGDRRRFTRHRADYSVTVFDEPGSAGWGWRFEGHHVSVNVTIVNGEVAATPLFLGSNPAEVRTPSGSAVVRPLAAEEDLALDLFAALPAAQRDAAHLGHDAPDDILTTNAPTLDELPDIAGVRVADLTGTAASTATALVRHYLDRLPASEADAWWTRLLPEIGDVRFAFAGEPTHLRPQYYRLAGPAFFVEYDNTQNDANHVHTVLRDPIADFGADLLRRHRTQHH
jgi:hypothetical protein